MIKKAAKIILLEEVETHAESFQGKKIVLVGGCFDLLHYGHYTFLKKAHEIGEYLIVAVESDEFILKYKHRKPVHSQRERAEILAELQCVDMVVILPYLTSDKEYESFVKKIHPNIVAVTKGDPQTENKKRQAEHVGGELQIVTPILRDFSSQKIIQALV